MNLELIDLNKYSISAPRPVVSTLYPALPRKTSKIPFDIYDFEMLFSDKSTVDLIREGKTIGCFYIESPGMRSLLKKLDVQSFEMLTAASSIIRPGVAESGMMQEYIKRHHDPSQRKYLHPLMETYLGETYGVMIYQEDVIKVANGVAGLSLEEADLLRRAMSGKMRSHDAMGRIQNKFFESCMNRNLSEEVAKELWRQIESFAGYSFCKAHSASFALLSYQVAYLKAHYTAEFMASVLSNFGGYYSSAVYIWEAKRLGIEVKLPSVNYSIYEYTGKDKTIRIGLVAVKNLSSHSCDRIVEERKKNGKYLSLADFLVRTKTGYEETATLIKCGAMDCFGESRPTLLRLLSVYINRRKILDENYNDLFMNETFRIENEIKTERNYDITQKCRYELDILGYMVSRHPLSFYRNMIPGRITNASDIYKHNKRRVRVVGWYMTSKRIRTKNDKIMKFLSLEDTTGTFEAIIFPNVYHRVAEKTMSYGPYIIEGKVDTEGGNNIIVEKLDVLSDISLKSNVQIDYAEDKYIPDDEGLTEKELYMSTVNTEQLIKAYAG